MFRPEFIETITKAIVRSQPAAFMTMGQISPKAATVFATDTPSPASGRMMTESIPARCNSITCANRVGREVDDTDRFGISVGGAVITVIGSQGESCRRGLTTTL